MQEIKFKSKSTLIISKELLAQISFLHHKIGGVEWSGLLYYSVIEGDISDPGALILKAERVYLMDIGSAAYTEFSPDSSIMSFYDKYPECEKMRWGMIHTHHGMNTFFSGTDMSELKENSGIHNYYLSLIVNYLDGGSYCAKIGMTVEVETEVVDKYNFKHGIFFKDIVDNKITDIKKDTKILTIDCNIVYEQDIFDLDRYDSIVKSKEASAKIRHIDYTSSFLHKQGKLDFHTPTDYIPADKHSIELFLASAIAVDMHYQGTLLSSLQELELQYLETPDLIETIYFDSFLDNLEEFYGDVFLGLLDYRHQEDFYKQCLEALSKYELMTFTVYPKLVEVITNEFIITEDTRYSTTTTKKSPKHYFSGKEKKVSKKDKFKNIWKH